MKVMSGKVIASLKSLFNYSQEDKPRYGTFHYFVDSCELAARSSTGM